MQGMNSYQLHNILVANKLASPKLPKLPTINIIAIEVSGSWISCLISFALSKFVPQPVTSAQTKEQWRQGYSNHGKHSKNSKHFRE